MQQLVPALLAAMLILAPLGAQAADLVVWWNGGYYAEEDEAVREIIAAFEHETGKQVELVLHPEQELPDKLVAAVEAGRPPDFAFSIVNTRHDEQWAYEGRLVDLTDAVGHFSDLFDPDALAAVTLLDATTGRRGLHLLPVGFATHHVHAWNSLLEQAGFTLEDIPTEWEAFWTFWCDEVQPAVREALGRDDIWGAGLTMSVDSNDTLNGFWQFVDAYEADYVSRDGLLLIDDPEVRRRLIKALDGYTAIYRKGCTPPDSVTWTNRDNNEAFLAQRIVMTINQTLSIPNTLKATRPEDYDDNAATIDWPDGAYGQPLPIETFVNRAAVFRDGSNVETAEEFVSFLVGEGWLAHYLSFSGERMLPTMPKLLEAPFWLDPSDPHRMRSAVQLLTKPRALDWYTPSDLRDGQVSQESVWPKAVHRVAAEGWSPEQAVDEAITREKQILSEQLGTPTLPIWAGAGVSWYGSTQVRIWLRPVIRGRRGIRPLSRSKPTFDSGSCR
jgi:multiple sugar transport system substrate-binding protein